MNRNWGLSLLLVCMLACIAQGDTNQFVKEKRTKKVSVARIKEDMGETIAQALLRTTEAVENLGKVQRELMQMMAALMEQPKESKLTQADRIALDKTLDALIGVECDLAAFSKRSQEHIEVVKKQY